MAFVKKRVINGRTYYYLQHTVRAGKKVEAREKYLGAKIPANLEEVTRRFLAEIYQGKWYPVLDRIRKNCSEDEKRVPKSVLEKQLRGFSVKFTYDTNRIEGSKLTYRETSDLLERGLTPRSKPVGDIKEAEAHEKVFYEIIAFKKDLTLQTVIYWHGNLFGATKPDIAGKTREYQVAISGSRFMPPSPAEVPALLDEFFKWYNSAKAKLHPVELAALVHFKFVTIHPFGDGNGRMSRLLMNFVLNKNGYPMLNIPYENRGSYYSSLERAQVKKNGSIFVQWLFKRYVKEYKKYAK